MVGDIYFILFYFSFGLDEKCAVSEIYCAGLEDEYYLCWYKQVLGLFHASPCFGLFRVLIPVTDQRCPACRRRCM